MEPELSFSEPVEVANFEDLHVEFWDVLSEGTFLVGAKEDSAGEVRRFDPVFDWSEHLKAHMAAGR